MVERRLSLEPEVRDILNICDGGKNFLLSGGAGSGKTYSLVQVIGQIIVENPDAKIACITYTNAAVYEIKSRINNRNLGVTTIHDFLWDNIKSFQKELKDSLITLVNNEEFTALKRLNDLKLSDNFFLKKNIQYKEYVLINEGIISHDEVLILAEYMFKEYPKLSNIFKSKFQFIFIDEYQDTSPRVISILLEHIKQSERITIVGFFGDSMQSIYDKGIGDLIEYIDKEAVIEVQKNKNRRNPKLIYELANQLRNDSLRQCHSADKNAPNMHKGSVKDGTIKFYYTITKEQRLDDVRKLLKWDFSDSKKTKELRLTHKLISQEGGFANLFDIYANDRILQLKDKMNKHISDNKITNDFSNCTFDQVIICLQNSDCTKAPALSYNKTIQEFIDGNPLLYKQAQSENFEQFRKININKEELLDNNKKDNLIKHLFKIQKNIQLYNQKLYNEFLRRTEFKIKSIDDKSNLAKIINDLNGMDDSTIEDVIDYADEKGVTRKDDNLQEFITKKNYVYNRVKEIKFLEFKALFNYLENYTVFSTQHKIKGAEFDNVLIIMDNGKWSKYNFDYMLNNTSDKEKIIERTLKLFYTCCTRAKENLAVYYPNPSVATVSTAKSRFGEKNMVLMPVITKRNTE